MPGSGASILSRVLLPRCYAFSSERKKLRFDIVKALADSDKLIGRYVDHVMDIDKMTLEDLGKHRYKKLLAQVAEFLCSHMPPVCGQSRLHTMRGNISYRDISHGLTLRTRDAA
ncbi:MAG: hypothetical protein WDN03_04020 [Rhizomicrobium sp.]